MARQSRQIQHMFALTERIARAWVTPGEWRKGEPYVRTLSRFTQRPADADIPGGTEYRALAHGSEYYRVSVTVQGGVVVNSACSCPVGGAGARCKHVAALLNKLMMGDGEFSHQPNLNALLDGLEEYELRRLVRRMLEKAPELEAMVYAGAAAKTVQAGQTAGTINFIPRIQAAFDLLPSGLDYEEWMYSEEELDTADLDEIVLELDRLRSDVSEFDEAQTEAVARAYIAILDGVNEFYEGDIDYGLEDIQAEGVAGLYDLFINADHLEGDLRDDALEALNTELVNGRLDFDDEFVNWFSVLLPNEQAAVRALIQKRAESSTSYARRDYLQALIDLHGGEPTEAETEAILRAEHSPVGLILFLLERGRMEEAVREVKQIKHHVPFAELQAEFQAAGALARLEEVAQQFKGYGQNEAQTWLCDLYASTGRRTQAYQMALDKARSTGYHIWFPRLKALSPDWLTERDDLIQRHWKSSSAQLLPLLIEENLPDLAYDFVGRDRASASDLQQVATMPSLDAQRAALLYLRLGQMIAKGRSRTAYAQAAGAMRGLIERVGADEAKLLVATHLPEHKQLPALRDELQKAGLL